MFIRQFEYLEALAREKHFRRAAESCHVSQPTLSAAIAQLEEELGVPLVERDGRFQGLTAEGEIVLARARRALIEIESLRAEVAEAREGLRGKLRFGVIPTALPMAVRVTAPFCAAFPAVTLEILSLTSDQIQQKLGAFEIDAGMTYLDNEPLRNVLSKPIYNESYCLLARADGPLGGRDRIRWAEAADLKLCLLTGDMQNRRIIDGLFRAVGKAPRPVVETNSIFNLITHAALPGVASIASRQVLDLFGPPAGVVALTLVEPEARHMIGLVAADRQPMPPLPRKLLEKAPSPDEFIAVSP
jgi:DNA-binding transcriptional LysR family regulator